MAKTQPVPSPVVEFTDPGDLKRQQLGVILVSRRLHFALVSADIVLKKARMLGDIAFLQRRMAEWEDDGTNFGKSVRNMAVMVILDAAKDARLTNIETTETMD